MLLLRRFDADVCAARLTSCLQPEVLFRIDAGNYFAMDEPWGSFEHLGSTRLQQMLLTNGYLPEGSSTFRSGVVFKTAQAQATAAFECFSHAALDLLESTAVRTPLTFRKTLHMAAAELGASSDDVLLVRFRSLEGDAGEPARAAATRVNREHAYLGTTIHPCPCLYDCTRRLRRRCQCCCW